MTTGTILIISLVAGNIARIVYKAVRESKEEEDDEDEQATTGTTK